MHMNPNDIQIELFSDKLPGHFKIKETIATWIYNEFIHDIRKGVTYENVLSRFINCEPGKIPLRYAAFMNGVCVGTISLVKNDHARLTYEPWLSSLYVDLSYRKRGIAQALIETVKSAAWDMGYETLYLRTEYAGGYYRKLGWTFAETRADEYGLLPEVFKWDKRQRPNLDII